MTESTQLQFLSHLESLLGQEIAAGFGGRAAFATPVGVTVIIELQEADEDGPIDRFHLLAEVFVPPPDATISADTLALSLMLNRALMCSHAFALMMGDPTELLPRHLYLCHAAPISSMTRESLGALLEEFSDTASYLKTELNPQD